MPRGRAPIARDAHSTFPASTARCPPGKQGRAFTDCRAGPRANSGPQFNLWRSVRRPRIFPMIASQDRVHLPAQELQKRRQIEAMPPRQIRREIFLRQPEEPHRWIHPPPIFWMRRTRVLFLQMHEPTCSLDQALKIIRVLRFCPQPKMLENVVGFVVTLLIPAAEKPQVAGMLRDLVGRARGRAAAQFFDQLGNSLAFVHGKLSFVSAVMTGNRTPILFPREGCCVYGRG